MVARKPWFGRVLKWHRMADGHGCAYRGRIHTIHKPADRWYFTTDPDDPGGEQHAPSGPALAHSLEDSRRMAEMVLLVDRADRTPGPVDFGLVLAGAGFAGEDGRAFAARIDPDQGLLRIHPMPAVTASVQGPVLATVQPVFHHGGQILHWRISGPDGAHWDNSAYWREACQVISART